jgi:threonine dehydratase
MVASRTLIGRDEIDAARGRIDGWIRRTPILHPGDDAFGLPGRLAFKLELLQFAGSFKPRGAFSKILSSEVPAAGVIAASGGNFGLAVAYAARRLDQRAEIFVPSTSPPVKAERIRAQHADVRVIDGYYDDALRAERERAAETGALEMHAFDQPEVVAGQGTIAAEIEEQVPDAATILVAVGGGGLIGGIAAWYEGRVRVIGVEPETCPTLWSALRVGHPVDVEVSGYASDSLGPKRAGGIATAIAGRWVERVVLVPDDAIREAQRRLWDEVRVFAEPGGATALAAAIAGAYVPEPDERVVMVLSGANGDLRVLAS